MQDSGILNDTYWVNAYCQNCTSYLPTGIFDVTSRSQPFIYAMGPPNDMRSDSLSATIQRHELYGTFEMDMVQATGQSGIPSSIPTTDSSGSSETTDPKIDHDYAAIAHALSTTIAFVVLMPLGILSLRVLEKVRWHWINQVAASCIALAGGGIGIYLSMTYEQYKYLNSPHQVLGLIVLVCLLGQILLGAFHHRIFKHTHLPTRWGTIHKYAGHAIMVLGVITGSLGLLLADNAKWLLCYFVLVVVAAVCLGVTLLVRARSKRRKAVFATPAARNMNVNADNEVWTGRPLDGDIHLAPTKQPSVSK